MREQHTIILSDQSDIVYIEVFQAIALLQMTKVVAAILYHLVWIQREIKFKLNLAVTCK
jgi:hypothetical protein